MDFETLFLEVEHKINKLEKMAQRFTGVTESVDEFQRRIDKEAKQQQSINKALFELKQKHDAEQDRLRRGITLEEQQDERRRERQNAKAENRLFAAKADELKQRHRHNMRYISDNYGDPNDAHFHDTLTGKQRDRESEDRHRNSLDMDGDMDETSHRREADNARDTDGDDLSDENDDDMSDEDDEDEDDDDAEEEWEEEEEEDDDVAMDAAAAKKTERLQSKEKSKKQATLARLKERKDIRSEQNELKEEEHKWCRKHTNFLYSADTLDLTFNKHFKLNVNDFDRMNRITKNPCDERARFYTELNRDVLNAQKMLDEDLPDFQRHHRNSKNMQQSRSTSARPSLLPLNSLIEADHDDVDDDDEEEDGHHAPDSDALRRLSVAQRRRDSVRRQSYAMSSTLSAAALALATSSHHSHHTTTNNLVDVSDDVMDEMIKLSQGVFHVRPNGVCTFTPFDEQKHGSMQDRKLLKHQIEQNQLKGKRVTISRYLHRLTHFEKVTCQAELDNFLQQNLEKVQNMKPVNIFDGKKIVTQFEEHEEGAEEEEDAKREQSFRLKHVACSMYMSRSVASKSRRRRCDRIVVLCPQHKPHVQHGLWSRCASLCGNLALGSMLPWVYTGQTINRNSQLVNKKWAPKTFAYVIAEPNLHHQCRASLKEAKKKKQTQKKKQRRGGGGGHDDDDDEDDDDVEDEDEEDEDDDDDDDDGGGGLNETLPVISPEFESSFKHMEWLWDKHLEGKTTAKLFFVGHMEGCLAIKHLLRVRPKAAQRTAGVVFMDYFVDSPAKDLSPTSIVEEAVSVPAAVPAGAAEPNPYISRFFNGKKDDWLIRPIVVSTPKYPAQTAYDWNKECHGDVGNISHLEQAPVLLLYSVNVNYRFTPCLAMYVVNKYIYHRGLIDDAVLWESAQQQMQYREKLKTDPFLMFAGMSGHISDLNQQQQQQQQQEYGDDGSERHMPHSFWVDDKSVNLSEAERKKEEQEHEQKELLIEQSVAINPWNRIPEHLLPAAHEAGPASGNNAMMQQRFSAAPPVLLSGETLIQMEKKRKQEQLVMEKLMREQEQQRLLEELQQQAAEEKGAEGDEEGGKKGKKKKGKKDKKTDKKDKKDKKEKKDKKKKKKKKESEGAGDEDGGKDKKKKKSKIKK